MKQDIKEKIENYFMKKDCLAKHNGKKLKINENNYRIMPDEQYIFPEKIILFEYEKNKRPVESITKYWWLLKKTDWLTQNINLELFLILENPKIDEIRQESCELLGKLLESQYHSFRFHFFRFDKYAINEIIKKIENQ